MNAIRNAIDRASANSPFLAGLMERNPDLMALIEAGDLDAALPSALARQSETVGSALRRQRQGVALVTALADLAGLWDLTRVTRILSDFADHALDQAIAAAIEERVPGAPNQGFAVIALGKHGGRELNYSSDIDPIFLFDPQTLPHRERDDVAEAAVRYGRRVIELLSALDADGYVFRVDMRLRPSPEVSPIVLPVEAAISYYESSALPWERAAYIRARACAGDVALGQRFLGAIRPFVWRRALDYGARAGRLHPLARLCGGPAARRLFPQCHPAVHLAQVARFRAAQEHHRDDRADPRPLCQGAENRSWL